MLYILAIITSSVKKFISWFYPVSCNEARTYFHIIVSELWNYKITGG